MRNYTILTKKSVLDIQSEISELDSDLQEKALLKLTEEQNALIKGKMFAIHMIEDKHFINESYEITDTLDDTIQGLAIKDGVDLVQFNNGNMGFIAYYNGHVNGFEFKSISKEDYNHIIWEENEEDIKNLF